MGKLQIKTTVHRQWRVYIVDNGKKALAALADSPAEAKRAAKELEHELGVPSKKKKKK